MEKSENDARNAPNRVPLVSLIMPVYNGMPFLPEALQSCIEQDYQNIEIIITDNASTDGTAEVCSRWAESDPRVTYVRNARNLGAAANFNLCFALSRGKYIKWCAADDRFSPNFVSHCVRVLEADPDVVLAYGASRSIDESGRAIPLVGRGMVEQSGRETVTMRFRRDLYDRATNFEIFGVALRSALAKTTLHRPYYGSDITLMNELTLLGRFACARSATLFNRDHPRRSIRLANRHLQNQWQDTQIRRRSRPLNLDRLLHLTAIVLRHRRNIPFFKVSAVVFIWTMHKMRDRLALTVRQLGLVRISGARS